MYLCAPVVRILTGDDTTPKESEIDFRLYGSESHVVAVASWGNLEVKCSLVTLARTPTHNIRHTSQNIISRVQLCPLSITSFADVGVNLTAQIVSASATKYPSSETASRMSSTSYFGPG